MSDLNDLDSWLTWSEKHAPDWMPFFQRVRSQLVAVAEVEARESASRCGRCGSPKTLTRRPLTKCQAAVYRYLGSFIARNCYAPSLEEIAKAFGYSSLATVHEHLQSLERKGWIRRTYNESRAIELLVTSMEAAA